MAESITEATIQGYKSSGAFGARDVLIITSSESLQLVGPDIVPRKKGQLSQDDKERLNSQDIPEECWEDDTKLMEGRYRKDEERYSLVSKGSKEVLTKEYIMGQIHALMNNTTKLGVTIGPGKKHTGDWCFPDGFIEFRDLINAYMEYFHKQSKCLEITSDCSHSGKWVLACKEFLYEVGVQPCGHSARKEKILLKVRASCRSHEIPHTMLYSARAEGNYKNTGKLYYQIGRFEVEQGQHIHAIDTPR